MTSILTYCKLLQNPSKVSAGNELTNVGNQLKLPKNEHVYEFSRVFTENCKSNELYAGMVDDVTKYFLGGYNACVFITGHCENLKSFLSGGFLHACVEEISNEISKRNKFKEKRKSSSNSSSKKAGTNLEVRMGIYEIFQERIVDLVTVSSEPPNETVKLVEDSFDGNVIRDEHCLYITDHTVKEATRYITVALDKSSLLSKNQQAASIVLELSLKKAIEGFEVPVSTWFRIVCLAPNFLKDQLNCNLTTAVSRKTSTQNQTISTADTLIKKVLADPIGGNCITKCCFVLEPVVQPNTNTLLSCLGHLRKVFNYPVDNTPHIKGLLRQYRNKVTYFEREMFREKGKNEAYAAQLKEQIARLEESNEKLMTEKIGLQETLTKLQTEQTVAIKTELSDQNKFSITEKLQMSKDAVELQLYANHLQQEAEEQLFEMKNKCLAEESKSSTLDRNLAYERKLHKDLKVKFDTLRLEHSELLEEYINLKTNYKAMCDKYHEQGEVNHDLNAAVTKLSHLKDKIVVEKNESHFCGIQGFSEKLSKLKQDILTISESLEVNAPKSSNMVSSSTVDVELLYQLCEDEFQELEQLLFQLKEMLNEKNASIEVYKRKIAELTTKFMLLQNDKEAGTSQILELKKSLSKLSAEYKARLEQYLKDLTIFLSTKSDEDFETKELIQQVEKMLSEYQMVHQHNDNVKQAEELKVTAQLILKKHEELLIAYRMLLQKHNKMFDEEEVLSYEIMMPPDHEIQLQSLKDRNQLKTKLLLAEGQVKELEEKLEAMRLKMRQLEENSNMELYDQNDPWNGVSKKVREFTMSVQHNLEKEKAQLLTRCHLAEQQLESYHDFMKETTQRYDLEISHLKYLLNDSYNMKAKANFSYDNQLAIPHGDPDGFLPPINQPYNGRYHQR